MSEQQYFARLDADNIVTDVVVASSLFMAENPDRYPGRWVETFIDAPDKTYAGVGYKYDGRKKDFTAPPLQPTPPEPDPNPTEGA